jgi:MinD-like ATPase involved in chromosome partitioning or flagellar assembly
MFSVNIDKLIAISPEQDKAYGELCENIIKKGDKYKTLAVIGENVHAFRIAAKFMKMDKKVLFIDADVTTPLFMGKYRLGKNLEGLCEYLDDVEDDRKLLCMTNYSNLSIMFAGEASRQRLSESDEVKLRRLLDGNMADYDYIVLEAGKSAEVGRNCLASIVLIDAASYDTKSARDLVEVYDNEGCLVLGVALVNA